MDAGIARVVEVQGLGLDPLERLGKRTGVTIVVGRRHVELVHRPGKRVNELVEQWTMLIGCERRGPCWPDHPRALLSQSGEPPGQHHVIGAVDKMGYPSGPGAKRVSAKLRAGIEASEDFLARVDSLAGEIA